MPEKKLKSGETVKLRKDGELYLVEMWTAGGESHWHKFFKSLAEAKVEYDRWN